eukprot:TRINITY_DN9656_c0_g1_i1.p1 TRINITY_DN9656_c0_g1~~TRINITY_DN9656_c0_g1_i1.p1  ORF type:complete len:172 (-),score=36.84 TRINITY_DN9656_c0_g1_i1:48-563(-)
MINNTKNKRKYEREDKNNDVIIENNKRILHPNHNNNQMNIHNNNHPIILSPNRNLKKREMDHGNDLEKKEDKTNIMESSPHKQQKNGTNDNHLQLPKRTKKVLVRFSENNIIEAKVLVMESWGIMVGLLEGSKNGDEEFQKGKKLFCKWKGEVKPIFCTPILQPIYKNSLY